MRKPILISFTLFFLFTTSVMAKVPDYSQQLVLIVTPTWQSVSGYMFRYEKENLVSQWNLVEQKVPIVVGRRGMGWGRGIYDPADASPFVFRREGDKRAPAGVFTFGTAFGILSENQARKGLKINFPYLAIDQTTQCVGDNRSRFYNDIVNSLTLPKDWNARANEDMYRIATRGSKLYRWGLEINNNKNSNPDPRMQKKSRAGACIFFHVWKGPAQGTAGCTAASSDNVVKLLTWLKTEKYPVIVQLPLSEYVRLKIKWKLPDLELN